MVSPSIRIALALGMGVFVTACSSSPIQTVGADTYQISRTAHKAASPASIKTALNTMGRARCAESDNAPYSVVSEDATVKGNRQTVTLTFQCKSTLKASAYTSNHPAVALPTATDTEPSVFLK